MRQTPGQMHMQMHMPPDPPRIAKFLKYHGSDRAKTDTWNTSTLLSHKPEYNKLRQIYPRCVDDLHCIDATIVFFRTSICSLPFTVLGVR